MGSTRHIVHLAVHAEHRGGKTLGETVDQPFGDHDLPAARSMAIINEAIDVDEATVGHGELRCAG